jgi:DNA-binding response OmpR family regulator
MTKHQRILVCDDDELLLDLLRFRLAARGYSVTAAHDGGEALAKIAEEKPDAVVLDAMMPVVDGFEVLRRIRENSETADVPVVMLSARKKERDIVGALELGANDFVVKPFIPEELLARLARLLGEEER